MTDRKIKVGLVLNPKAGVGGPVGLKGSDGVYDDAMSLGGESKVADRVAACLQRIEHDGIEWFTVPGEMGGDSLGHLGITFHLVDLGNTANTANTSAEDTRHVVRLLCEQGVDLLLFAGGDGTARDVADSIQNVAAVLGIPCGVKMHSGVFATTPVAAATLINKIIAGEILSVVTSDVRDIDENSFREGIVKTRFYGELPVPNDLRYVQQTKVGGREVDELVLQDIAAYFTENMDPEALYLMGSGSTVGTLMDFLCLESTLLGIDVIRNGQLLAADVSENQILEFLEDAPVAKIVVTAIGGQGHVFGRGNQQLSAKVIRQVGVRNLEIVATKSKLARFARRPLRVDTGDVELDEALAGMKSVLVGYDDWVLYQVA
jgi:predicted polyphosphate/ATP-dependent NAD kinase